MNAHRNFFSAAIIGVSLALCSLTAQARTLIMSAAEIHAVSVPPGGATIVDLKLEEPGKYIVVDHALSRMERGLAAFMLVEGKADPDIYRAGK